MNDDKSLTIAKPLVSFDEYGIVDSETNERLLDAINSTTELADNSLSPNTMRGYEHDWNHFNKWCSEMSAAAPAIDALPTSDKTLAIYLGAHRDDTPATMQRRFAAIRHTHNRQGYNSPFENAPVFSIVLKGYKRSWAKHKPSPQRAAMRWRPGKFSFDNCLNGSSLRATGVLLQDI